MFGDMRFDMRIGRFEHTYSRPFQGPVQIMRQTISNIDMPKHAYKRYKGLFMYHRYKGLSNIGYKGLDMFVCLVKRGWAGNKEDTLDYLYTKHHIYKHNMFDMADIRFDMFDMFNINV